MAFVATEVGLGHKACCDALTDSSLLRELLKIKYNSSQERRYRFWSTSTL